MFLICSCQITIYLFFSFIFKNISKVFYSEIEGFIDDVKKRKCVCVWRQGSIWIKA